MKKRAIKVFGELSYASTPEDDYSREDEKLIRQYAHLSYGTDPIVTPLANEIERMRSERKLILLKNTICTFLFIIIFIAICISSEVLRDRSLISAVVFVMFDSDAYSTNLALGFTALLFIATVLHGNARAPRPYSQNRYKRTLQDHIKDLYRRGHLNQEGFTPAQYKFPYRKIMLDKSAAFLTLDSLRHSSHLRRIERKFPQIDFKSYLPSIYKEDMIFSERIDHLRKAEGTNRVSLFLCWAIAIYYFVFYISLPFKIASQGGDFAESARYLLTWLNGNTYTFFAHLEWYWKILVHAGAYLLLITLRSTSSPSPKQLRQLKGDIFDSIEVLARGDKLGYAGLVREDRASPLLASSSATDVVKDPEYDVAISFAGEDRHHAQDLAKKLRGKGITVFYDEYMQADLWGRDLAQHLHRVYSKQARFCVVFISASYARKVWTTHELRSALERAVRSTQGQYILPIRLDDTEVDGLPATVGYLPIEMGIPRIAELILEKIASNRSSATFMSS